MNTYLIKITILAPYPIETEYKEQANKAPAAVRRAMEKNRIEYKKKRYNTTSIEIIKL